MKVKILALLLVLVFLIGAWIEGHTDEIGCAMQLNRTEQGTVATCD